jgi:DNA repair exonuclease SbcCD ATPase subunit
MVRVKSSKTKRLQRKKQKRTRRQRGGLGIINAFGSVVQCVGNVCTRVSSAIAKANRQRLEDEANVVLKKLDNNEAELYLFNNQLNTLPKTLKERVNEIEKKKDEIKEFNDEIRVINEQIKSHDNHFSDALMKEKREDVEKIRAKIRNNETNISTLETTSLTSSRLLEDLPDMIERLETENTNLEKDLERIKKELGDDSKTETRKERKERFHKEVEAAKKAKGQ